MNYDASYIGLCVCACAHNSITFEFGSHFMTFDMGSLQLNFVRMSKPARIGNSQCGDAIFIYISVLLYIYIESIYIHFVY